MAWWSKLNIKLSQTAELFLINDANYAWLGGVLT